MPARIGLSSRLIRRTLAGPNFACPRLFPCVAVVHRRAPLSTAQLAQKRGRFLTVAFTPEAYTTEQILQYTHASLATYYDTDVLGRSNGAVLLVSKSLAHLLDQPEFLSDLLAPWRGQASEMDILAAVVDSVRVPQDPYVDPPPSEGFAIMAGNASSRLLPGLWEESNTGAKTGSIEFHLPPLADDERPLQVTFPLANTLFTNAKDYTMFAARLTSEPGAYPEFTAWAEKSSQIVNPGKGHRYYSSMSAPLVPITRPRKIVTGLGNILKQVEIDDEPVGASQELEKYIPEFLEALRSRENPIHERPLTVWAVIYPEHVVSANGHVCPRPLDPQKGGTICEPLAAKPFLAQISKLLADGCHIRKVLSGGGGWGKKQGLLSLDPESSYSTSDQEDVESFIRSFNGEESAGTGIVTPGSWVQFMVEQTSKRDTWQRRPPLPYKEIRKYERSRETVSLGVKDEFAEISSEKKLRLAQEYFGVSSSPGLYIAFPSEGKPGIREPPIATKVGVPRGELISFL